LTDRPAWIGLLPAALLALATVPPSLGLLSQDRSAAWWALFLVPLMAALITSILVDRARHGAPRMLQAAGGYLLAIAMVQSAGGPHGTAIALVYLWAALAVPRLLPERRAARSLLAVGAGAILALASALTEQAMLADLLLVTGALLALALFADGSWLFDRTVAPTVEIDGDRDPIRPDAELVLVDRGLPGPSDTDEVERLKRNKALRRQTVARLRDVARWLMTATGATRVALLRLSADGAFYIPELLEGDSEPVVSEVSTRKGIFALLQRSESGAEIRDCKANDPRLVHLMPGSHNTRTTRVLPLDLPEGRLGVLVVDSDEEDAFADADRRQAIERASNAVLQLVAISAALREADLVVNRTRQFYLLSRALSGCRGQQEVAELLVHELPRLANVDALAVVLADEDMLQVRSARGFEPVGDGHRFVPDRATSLVAQAVEHRSVVYRQDISRDAVPPRLFGEDPQLAARFSNLIVFPLAPINEEAVGAVVLARHRPPPLGAETEEKVELLLEQAALVLQHNQLLDENQERAITDGMSGLPNHRRFQEVLEEMLARAARAGDQPLSLIILDIDHFKAINDNYGHPMGDEVIRRLARLLKKSRSGLDLAARYGGEEFCLALENTPADGAARRAERLREQFADLEFVLSQGMDVLRFRCTLSAGVATFPQHADSRELLIQRADEALYRAKQGGRNRVVIYGS
jgi:diguanylate cyclase (GGDEF)-like protein